MASPMPSAEERRFLAHVADLQERAEKGEMTVTVFLTPQMQKRLVTHLALTDDHILFAGGYPAAERRRLIFLPPYVREAEGELREAILADIYAEKLCPVALRGSGYLALSHRDFLGAVLNLGIKREAIGDLCVIGPHEAVLFCDRLMFEFLKENLTRVGGDAVRVLPALLPPDFDGGRRFAPISDTVASPRADGVVAALCNLSRERARALFVAGLVEIDYEAADKPDREITAGAVITVRGEGKFVIRSVSEQTKKGRYRLLADRYL